MIKWFHKISPIYKPKLRIKTTLKATQHYQQTFGISESYSFYQKWSAGANLAKGKKNKLRLNKTIKILMSIKNLWKNKDDLKDILSKLNLVIHILHISQNLHQNLLDIHIKTSPAQFPFNQTKQRKDYQLYSTHA